METLGHKFCNIHARSKYFEVFGPGGTIPGGSIFFVTDLPWPEVLLDRSYAGMNITKLVSQCFHRKTRIQVITITKSTLDFDAF